MADVGMALESIGAAPQAPGVSAPPVPIPRTPTVVTDSKTALTRMGELGGERKTSGEAYDRTAGDLQGRIAKENASAAGLAVPKLDAIDKPFKYQGMSPEQMSTAMSTMFAFAALGGAMTRAPMTSALKSFSAALQGLHQGDEILYKREAGEFDRNLRVAMAKNQQAMTEYSAAFQRHKGNAQDLQNEWSIIAKKHGDTVAQVNMERQDVQGMIKHFEAMKKMDQQMGQQQQNFNLQMRKLDEQMTHNRATEATGRANTAVAQMRANAAALKASADNRPLTEGEKKTGLFYSQMSSAENEIANILEQGFSTGIGGQIGARMAGSDLFNWAAPEDAQRYAQSTEQWAEAYLRLKTGAATNANEIKRNARAFFPQIGDKEVAVDQKNRMRAQAISDVQRAAGRGAGGAAPAAAGGGAPGLPPRNAQGWPLHVDAHGNKAYVGPNNQIQEVSP